jgi:hypothetical protein
MKPVTPQNEWILRKIAAYMASKEGCIATDVEFTDKGATVTLQDVFGFQYELNIKTVTRIQTEEAL